LYNGRKRGVYQRAVDSLLVRGLTVADSFVSTFIKAEKVNFAAKVDPAPRVIQPRSPRYNVEVGRYLKLFEKALFTGFARAFGYPVVLKGMNADEVGACMHRNWLAFTHPVAVGLDASRFDQHVSRSALEWEHSVYNAAFQSSELRGLLRMQLRNRGIARADGYRVDYTVEGCRMSGDMNTGMGNCLLMSSIVIAYCEQAGVKHRLANNGDDCVVFLEAEDLAKLDGLDQWFLEFGFTLTREAPRYVLEEVEFCQTHPVLVGGQYRMVRNPLTAMSKDCVSLLSWDTPEDIRSWCASVAACGLSLTSGVPVWQSWYSILQRAGGAINSGVDERVKECGMWYMARGVREAVVDDCARVSFWRAFGILPDLQIALEQYYDRITGLGSLTPVMLQHPICGIDLENPISRHEDQDR
jgi:hypothetical protein